MLWGSLRKVLAVALRLKPLRFRPFEVGRFLRAASELGFPFGISHCSALRAQRERIKNRIRPWQVWGRTHLAGKEIRVYANDLWKCK
jgi:hypothetical protein